MKCWAALARIWTILLACLLNTSSSFAEIDEQRFDQLIEVLREYEKHPNLKNSIDADIIKLFSQNTPERIRLLPDPVVDARIDQFTPIHMRYKRLVEKVESGLIKEKEKLKSIALSDEKRRIDTEMRLTVKESQVSQIKKLLFMNSIEANRSLLDAFHSHRERVEASELAQGEKEKIQSEKDILSKLPGDGGETAYERSKKSDSDKVFLTPVDPEFYDSQLGKKLEKDLGGRAEYWSYDYGTDELYVKVGDSVGKLRVKEQSPGARFIQTRIGENFVDPVGSDEKVDSLKAQGRFLTGVSSEESLFGPFPQKEPKIFDESKLPHNKDDGHDHDH